jgi:choline dehydrogenase-like flavoprotein
MPETRVSRLTHHAGRWQLCAEQKGDKPRALTIEAETVFAAGGAIQTAALLRRSGISRLAGQRLHMHPTVKMVARFPEPVNQPGMGVPVHQVKEFAPRISLGGSVSSPPYLALAMIDHPAHAADCIVHWNQHAVYYAMTRGGQGSVRPLPCFRDPLVRYRLTADDLADLAEGLRRLGECLFAAGATTLYSCVRGSQPLTSPDDLKKITTLAGDQANLMTIHLFSSCPMGEVRERCVTDSFGRVHRVPHLHVADASLLCGPPGVNPQGSIMAIVRRNVADFLERK